MTIKNKNATLLIMYLAVSILVFDYITSGNADDWPNYNWKERLIFVIGDGFAAILWPILIVSLLPDKVIRASE